MLETAVLRETARGDLAACEEESVKGLAAQSWRSHKCCRPEFVLANAIVDATEKAAALELAKKRFTEPMEGLAPLVTKTKSRTVVYVGTLSNFELLVPEWTCSMCAEAWTPHSLLMNGWLSSPSSIRELGPTAGYTRMFSVDLLLDLGALNNGGGLSIAAFAAHLEGRARRNALPGAKVLAVDDKLLGNAYWSFQRAAASPGIYGLTSATTLGVAVGVVCNCASCATMVNEDGSLDQNRLACVCLDATYTMCEQTGGAASAAHAAGHSPQIKIFFKAEAVTASRTLPPQLPAGPRDGAEPTAAHDAPVGASLQLPPPPLPPPLPLLPRPQLIPPAATAVMQPQVPGPSADGVEPSSSAAHDAPVGSSSQLPPLPPPPLPPPPPLLPVVPPPQLAPPAAAVMQPLSAATRHTDERGGVASSGGPASTSSGCENLRCCIPKALPAAGQHAATGMGAAVCAHNCPAVGCAVNMRQPENFGVFGAVMMAVLEGKDSIRVNYFDSSCAFNKYFLDLVKTQGMHTSDGWDAADIKFMIDWMHMKGHIPSCRYVNGAMYIINTGRRIGAQCEQLWSWVRIPAHN
jgi:hypothetical protein